MVPFQRAISTAILHDELKELLKLLAFPANPQLLATHVARVGDETVYYRRQAGSVPVDSQSQDTVCSSFFAHHQSNFAESTHPALQPSRTPPSTSQPTRRQLLLLLHRGTLQCIRRQRRRVCNPRRIRTRRLQTIQEKPLGQGEPPTPYEISRRHEGQVPRPLYQVLPRHSRPARHRRTQIRQPQTPKQPRLKVSARSPEQEQQA